MARPKHWALGEKAWVVGGARDDDAGEGRPWTPGVPAGCYNQVWEAWEVPLWVMMSPEERGKPRIGIRVPKGRGWVLCTPRPVVGEDLTCIEGQR